MRDLQIYAADRLSELLDIKGFVEVADAVSAIEDIEDDFDGDSYCPYYAQQDEVIRDYEAEFGSDAEDICGGVTYPAWEWQKAQTSYAYAIAYTAFSSYLAAAKDDLIEGLHEFESDIKSEFGAEDIRICVTSSSLHGWAAHDSELEDGTMIFESGQLDGCNGMERKIGSSWVSCCFDETRTESGRSIE
jgi:hypothetical protein